MRMGKLRPLEYYEPLPQLRSDGGTDDHYCHASLPTSTGRWSSAARWCSCGHPREGGILILLSIVASLQLTATCNRWFML